MTPFDHLANKALKLQLAGKNKLAQKIYLKLIKENTNSDKLMFLIGTSYLQTDDYDKAISYLSKSIKLNPHLPEAYNNRGIALAKKKRYVKSIEDYDIAINQNKKFFDAYLNKGISLKNIKQAELAIDCFKICIKLNPNNFKIYNNLGNTYKDLKNYQKAVESYTKAIQINKNYLEPYFNRANLLFFYKHVGLAINDYEKIIELKGDFDFLYGNLIHAKMNVCDWNDYEFLIKKIKFKLSKNIKTIKPFQIISINDDQSQHRVIAKNYFEYLHSNLSEAPKINHNNNKKIKVGYFSGDFHNHPITQLMLNIFKNHDKSKFEIYGFYHAPINDEWTSKVSKYFNKFFNVNEYTEEEIALLSRKNKIDIAIDLSGYTKYSINKTYYYRAAPIQINYLGYPGTMGNNFYDYIIADKHILPASEFKNFSEKVLYLPNCYQANRTDVEISKKIFSRKDFNLPKAKFVFGCLNTNYKINPSVFNCWMTILDKCKNSILWLLKNNEESSKNLIKEAIKRGVNPDRIIFAERTSVEIHLKRLQYIDLFLDTFPYGAHTTASEAIRMGVPVLTIIGKSFASRVASSMLLNIKLEELIAKNMSEYIKIAVALAHNENKLKKLKIHIKNKDNVNILFNDKKFTHDLENIYLDVFNKKI